MSNGSQYLLTDSLQRLILGHMTSRVANNNLEHYQNLPAFVIKMLALNKVICYRCLKEIEVNTFYRSGPSARIKKYYHPECLESLYQ